MAPNITCAMIPDRGVLSAQHLNQTQNRKLVVLFRIANGTSAHCSVTFPLLGFHSTPKRWCLVAFLNGGNFVSLMDAQKT